MRLDSDQEALPRVGDYVRFRRCAVRARGMIIERLSDDYVRVQWTDWAVPTTHRRQSLEIDAAAAGTGA